MNRILSYYKKDIFLFYDDFLRMVFVSNYNEIDGGSIELTQRQMEIIEIIIELDIGL